MSKLLHVNVVIMVIQKRWALAALGQQPYPSWKDFISYHHEELRRLRAIGVVDDGVNGVPVLTREGINAANRLRLDEARRSTLVWDRLDAARQRHKR